MRILGYFEIINPFLLHYPYQVLREFDDLQNQILKPSKDAIFSLLLPFEIIKFSKILKIF